MERSIKSYAKHGYSLHKLFKTAVKYISQDFPPLGESGSEVSHFITEPRNFDEVTELSNNIKKPRPKKILEEIKNSINSQNFIVEDPEKDEPVTPCMDVYKAKIQSVGSLDKVTLRVLDRGDL